MAQAFSLREGIKELKERIIELKKRGKFVIVGIAGASCSGKTFTARKIKAKVIPFDDYYIGLKKMNKKKVKNFDEPKALDLKLLKKHLKELKKGRAVRKPIYDMKTHERKGIEKFIPSKIMILEGLYALRHEILKFIDLKVFVESPKKLRLKRRIERDEKERAWSKKEAIQYFNQVVEPNYKKYVLPTIKNTEIIIKN
ncbi:MAG: hypothetical protein AB1467_06370 [Candidatus Diapherotrites archaeon]